MQTGMSPTQDLNFRALLIAHPRIEVTEHGPTMYTRLMLGHCRIPLAVRVHDLLVGVGHSARDVAVSVDTG